MNENTENTENTINNVKADSGMGAFFKVLGFLNLLVVVFSIFYFVLSGEDGRFGSEETFFLMFFWGIGGAIASFAISSFFYYLAKIANK